MFRIKTETMETRPFDVARDSWRQMQRNGMRDVGEYWFRNMLPQHFTPQAKQLYEHRPRSRKYQLNKENLAQRGIVKLGGRVDNVFRGYAMQSIKSTAIIRGFPTRCTVFMHGPDYLRMKFKAGTNQPNKTREIVTTTPKESEQLKQILVKSMEKQLRHYRRRYRHRLG